jgi:hypothetical protein
MYDDVPDAAGLRKLYDTQQYHDNPELMEVGKNEM